MLPILILVAASASAIHIQNILQLPTCKVDSSKLQHAITKDALRERAEALYNASLASQGSHGNPTRVIGLPGHLKTIEYITEQLKLFGSYYKVSVEPFHAVDGHVDQVLLLVEGIQPKLLAAFGLTPATGDPIFAKLVAAKGLGCDPSDFGPDARGNIVLLQRGTCPFGEKLRQAGLAGAAAIVVYDPASKGKQLHGTMGKPHKDHVPSVLVLGTEGMAYAAVLATGKSLQASIYVDSVIKKIRTLNIVAETVDGDHENVVALGAHSDSVGEGPGINDDGSGTVSLLEVANQLRHFKVENAVRFGWFLAEEEGLVGSSHHAAHLLPQENLKVRVFMDYDMMASPNYEYQIYDANDVDHPAGLERLKQLYVDYYTEHGLNYTLIPFDGRSDYVGFVEAGIPAGGIATGAEGIKDARGANRFGGEAGKWFDPCYHQICDDLLNPDYDAWLVNTRLIAHSVATFANSWDGFPERQAVNTKDFTAGFKYRGSLLFV